MAGKSADVVFIDSSLIFNNDIYKMTMADVFVDMSDFIENDPEFNKEDFVMPVIDGAKINGKQYIMPLSYHLPLFFSTEEALEKAGIDKQNFNDTKGMIDELTGYYERHSEDKVMPKAFTWSVSCGYMLKYAGVDIIDYADSKIYTDNPLLKNVMDFWKLAYLSEWKNSNAGTISTQSSDLNAQRLDEGTIVMFLMI